MSAQDLEQHAREYLAAEYERDGKTGSANHIRTQPLLPNKARAVRAIAAALRQQPAPAELSEVTRQLIERDRRGRAKYGTNLDRTDLSLPDWLQHMAEELLDAAGYALAAKRTAQQPAPGDLEQVDRTDRELLTEFIRICREHKPVGQWPGERLCAAIERVMQNEKPFRFIAEADMAPERGHNGRGGDADRPFSGPRCAAPHQPAPVVDDAMREGCVGAMTPARAAYFLRRFKTDEKMLGPHEQWALDFAITALGQQPAPVVDDAMVDAAIAAQDAHWANDDNYPARAPRSVKGDAELHDKLARGAMRAALTAARAQGVKS